MGDMSDWRSWDLKACSALAIDIAGEAGASYAEFYSKFKKAKSKKAKAVYEANMNTLQRFLENGFTGSIIDSETFLSGIRYRVNHGDMCEYKRHGGSE